MPVDRHFATVISGPALSGWILRQRPPRRTLDPFKPHGFFLEQERSRSGSVVESAVILLTNKECPWRCLMCDLWMNTLPHTVPVGALPQQVKFALAQLGSKPSQVKLYNSGSFFDAAAVPVTEYPAIARAVALAENVVVESHPRLVGRKALRFRDLIPGSLEVAIGLETIHPKVLPRLNKKFDCGHFTQAADFLLREKIALRVFILVQPPFLNTVEGLEWTVKSAAYAFSRGAAVVSLIATRGGNGAMERLSEVGEFSPPRLAALEKALEQVLPLRGEGRVFADTWNLEALSDCLVCLEKRRQRLQAINWSQTISPAIDCPACGGQ